MLSHRSSPCKINVSMHRQVARKNALSLFSQATQSDRAKLQSNPRGMPKGRLEVLELTDIFTPLLNKPPFSDIGNLPFQGGKFLSPLCFVIDCVY